MMRSSVFALRCFAGIVAAALFAACSGGGGSGGPAVVPTATPSVIPTPSASSSPGTKGTIRFQISFPSSIGTSSRHRKPHYVSPATSNVNVAVNGGAAQSYSVATAQSCTTTGPTAAPGTCKVFPITAAIGTDTFLVTLTDSTGNVLSEGTTTATIVAGVANTVSVTFDGVVSGLTVALQNPISPAGTSASIPIVVLPTDADGFTLIGSPGTLPAVTLSDTDTSGVTGLFLAGNDGTCATQAAPPATTLTVSQSTAAGATGQYATPCLSYSGGTIPGGSATIGGSVGGGITGSVTFTPSTQPVSGSVTGAWLMVYTGSQFQLERFDANLNVQNVIGGSNSGFATEGVPPVSLSTDTAGNVYVLVLGGDLQADEAKIEEFGPSQSGNVSPIATTTLSGPGLLAYFTIGANGTAYLTATANGGCQIYTASLTGTTSVLSPLATCGARGGGPIAFDREGRLYVGDARALDEIDRYATGNGTPTFESAIARSTFYGYIFAFDTQDNILVGGNELGSYPLSDFVIGQVTNPGPPVKLYGVYTDFIAVDSSDDIFSATNNQHVAPSISVVRPDGTGQQVDLPGGYTSMALAAATAPTTVGTNGALGVSPTSLSYPGSATQVVVSEPGYSGAISATSTTCGAIAAITPSQALGPSATFSITPSTTQAGTCTFVFTAATQSAQVPVTVTTVGLIGQSRSRR